MWTLILCVMFRKCLQVIFMLLVTKILLTRRLLHLQSKCAGDCGLFVSTMTHLEILLPPLVRGLLLGVRRDRVCCGSCMVAVSL